MLTTTFKDIWQSIQLDSSQTRKLSLGELELWFFQHDNEFSVMSKYIEEPVPDFNFDIVDSHPEDLERQRWIIPEGVNEFQIRPALPDRPIVARPESSVFLLPKQAVVFFLEIPCNIQFSLKSDTNSFCEFPTKVLSNTWFGNVFEGQLCFSLLTSAKQSESELSLDPFRVICPLEISNKTNEPLQLERLFLQVQFLDLFLKEGRLWANKGKMQYNGKEDWSEISFDKKKSGDNMTLISKARSSSDKNILFKTFDSIRSFPKF